MIGVKSLLLKHKIGILGAFLFAILTKVSLVLYESVRASFEASLAVKQLEDSIIMYSLVQKIIYHDAASGVIFLIGSILIVLCLLPTMKTLLKEEI